MIPLTPSINDGSPHPSFFATLLGSKRTNEALEEDHNRLINELTVHNLERCLKKKKGNEISCGHGYPKKNRAKTEIIGLEGELKNMRVETIRNHPCVNNYNIPLLETWRANLDVSYIANAYGAAIYVAWYSSKCEPNSFEFQKKLSKSITKLPSSSTLRQQLTRFANTSLSTRQIFSQEAAYLLVNNMPLVGKSREIVFLNVTLPKKRKKIINSRTTI